jgi:hypothetical protein
MAAADEQVAPAGEEESQELPQAQPSRAASDGQEQPGTPDQQEDQLTTPSAAAAAAAAAMAGMIFASRVNSDSDGSVSPEHLRYTQAQASVAADATAPAQQGQPQLQGSLSSDGSLLAASLQGLRVFDGSPGPAAEAAAAAPMPPSPFEPGLAPAPSSGEQSSLHTDSVSGSLFGSPGLSIPLFGAASGPAPVQPRLASPTARPPGLPPLPGRQPPSSAGAVAGSLAAFQQDADQLLSARLQDALFVGSPSLSSPAHQQHGLPSPQRRALLASLAPGGSPRLASPFGASRSDAEAARLLSGSGNLGRLGDPSLLRRTLSSSVSAGSGSPGGLAGAAAAAARAAAAEALVPGSGTISPSIGVDSGSDSGGSSSQRALDAGSDEVSAALGPWPLACAVRLQGPRPPCLACCSTLGNACKYVW